MNKPTFEMTAELATLRTSIETMDDLSPEETDAFLDQAITAYLSENMAPERVGKTIGFIQAVLLEAAEIEGAAKAYADYADGEMKRAKWRKNRIERVKQTLMNLMEVAKVDELQGDGSKLAIQLNPPAVDVVDASLVPEAYWKAQDPVLDKAGASSDMKAGKDIPGLCLTRSKKLVIR